MMNIIKYQGKEYITSIREVADYMRELGADHCIMSTDFGRYALSTATEGLRQYIACMLDLGISADEIRTMVKTNPEWLPSNPRETFLHAKKRGWSSPLWGGNPATLWWISNRIDHFSGTAMRETVAKYLDADVRKWVLPKPSLRVWSWENRDEKDPENQRDH